jgi:hypothetical protein
VQVNLVASVALVFVVGLGPAHADWLDNAWSDKSVAEHGNPAITVRSDGVSVVLSAATLLEAQSEGGMATKDALRAFLNRYSPQCSTVLNLNIEQPNLTVDLTLQVDTALGEAPAPAQDEVLRAMEQVEIPATSDNGATARPQIPRITNVFIVLPRRLVFSIDYAPNKIVHCVAPPDAIS